MDNFSTANRRRRWLTIVAGVLVFLVVVGVAAIVAVTILVRDRVDIETSTEENATGEFQKIRARFGHTQPLLEIGSDGQPHYLTTAAASGGAGARPETLHILAWDPEDGELARVSLPFWILRMKSTPFKFDSSDAGLDQFEIRVEDIERFGPGLLLDHLTDDGDHVLLWAQ